MRSIKLLEAGKLLLSQDNGVLHADKETVKVQVKACAICGSDLALYRGYRDISRETYFGHEFPVRKLLAALPTSVITPENSCPK